MERLTEQCLVIRTDVNTQIGMGHFMRCLALAQNWQDKGGRSIFVMSEPGFEDRLKSEGMEAAFITSVAGTPQDAFETIEIASRAGSSWIVIDGYNFDAQYQENIKDKDLNLLFIDDMGHCDHYYADIVLNQNLHANKDMYNNRESYTELLLGTRYVLLRREFQKWRGWKREIPKVAKKLLVTMGGGDPNDVTTMVLQAIKDMKIDNLQVTVLMGAKNPHFNKVQFFLKDFDLKVNLIKNVTDVSEYLAWADLAIAGAGSTSWELSFMGLPCLVLVLADNQHLIADKLERVGAALNLGWYNTVSFSDISQALNSLANSKSLANMSKIGRDLVDGRGVDRVSRKLTLSQVI